MKNSEILAVIAQMEEQLASLKAMLNENEVVESTSTEVESVVVEPAEELPAPPEVVVIPELVEENTIVEVSHYDFSEEIKMANAIVLKKGLIDLVPDGYRIDSIDIHLKVLPPKEDGQKPYVLWKQGIYEIDMYDIDSNLLGTSQQFVLDSLGQDIVMYLRKKGVGGYEKKTYEPKHCWLCCND